MERYILIEGGPTPEFRESKNGYWVKWQDVKKELDALKKENEELKAKVLELVYWQQLSNDFIRDHQKLYDEWKLKN